MDLSKGFFCPYTKAADRNMNSIVITSYSIHYTKLYDGKPGGSWSAAQINTIYASLKGNLNGAELIGHCSWGVPAGIEVIKNTNISYNFV